MEIVINIPDSVYNTAKRYSKDKHCIKIYEVDDVLNAIANGTSLPKGHGKIVDENELKKEAIRCEWSRNMYDTLDRALSYMKPIIEADRKEQK